MPNLRTGLARSLGADPVLLMRALKAALNVAPPSPEGHHAFLASQNHTLGIDDGHSPGESISFSATMTAAVAGDSFAIDADWEVTGGAGGTAIIGDTITFFLLVDGIQVAFKEVDILGTSKLAQVSFTWQTDPFPDTTTPHTITVQADCNNTHTIASVATTGAIKLQEQVG